MTGNLLDENTLRSLQALNGEGGDPFLANLIDIYIRNGNEILGELQVAIGSKKMDTTMHLAHKLKGMSLNVGAAAVFSITEDLETNSKQGKQEELEALFLNLRPVFESTCEELTGFWSYPSTVQE